VAGVVGVVSRIAWGQPGREDPSVTTPTSRQRKLLRRAARDPRYARWRERLVVLFAGNADDLLLSLVALVPEGVHTVGTHAGAARPDGPVDIAIVVNRARKRSALLELRRTLQGMPEAVGDSTIVLAVLLRRGARVVPGRVVGFASGEILNQLMMAVDPEAGRAGRTLRERMGLLALNAAGVEVLRLG
jgi:hypothetical protein